MSLMSLAMKVNPNESPPLVLSEFVLERQLVATVIYYRCSFFVLFQSIHSQV